MGRQLECDRTPDRPLRPTLAGMKRYFRRHIALPTDHGSWVFIFSPLLIGLFAGGKWSIAEVFLIIAAMAGFLIRQPITIAVKVYSGRRGRNDIPAARFWIVIYSLIGLAGVAGLVYLGFSYLLLLAIPGLPVFLWHLYLVSKREERRQAGIEVVATGVLSLAAPAAYWVAVGQPASAGWWLFGLTWLQSAASIVHAYLRLEQREMKSIPPLPVRLRIARRALLYTTFNFIATLALGLLDILPGWLFVPFALQWTETVWGSYFPAVGYKPTRIGVRQLIVSTLFTLLFILTWRLG